VSADRASANPARLVDTTMLYAPRSGGVKRYLNAKRSWLARRRPAVRHTLVAPGPRDSHDGHGRISIYAAPLPFGDGYRWPLLKTAWMERLVRQRPSIIEAGDPYTPGLAAQKAGEALGVPVIGFCHTDLGALAALHFGDWAEKPVRRRWAAVYSRFDLAVAPSRFIAGRLAEAGVEGAVALPLGVDTEAFRPVPGAREALRRDLGLSDRERLLVFAGRPAREKRLEVLVEAVERLGDPYRLLLVGAGAAAPPSDRTLLMDYRRTPEALARVLAGCDAFVHANENPSASSSWRPWPAVSPWWESGPAGWRSRSTSRSGRSPRARRAAPWPRRSPACSTAIRRPSAGPPAVGWRRGTAGTRCSTP